MLLLRSPVLKVKEMLLLRSPVLKVLLTQFSQQSQSALRTLSLLGNPLNPKPYAPFG